MRDEKNGWAFRTTCNERGCLGVSRQPHRKRAVRTWPNPLNLLTSRRFGQFDLTRRVRDAQRVCPISVRLSPVSGEGAKFTETFRSDAVSMNLSLPKTPQSGIRERGIVSEGPDRIPQATATGP
jgi:hypothetical protein